MCIDIDGRDSFGSKTVVQEVARDGYVIRMRSPSKVTLLRANVIEPRALCQLPFVGETPKVAIEPALVALVRCELSPPATSPCVAADCCGTEIYIRGKAPVEVTGNLLGLMDPFLGNLDYFQNFINTLCICCFAISICNTCHQ